MIVLDCSAAMAIVLQTAEGEAFCGLMQKNEKVISPQLFIAELNSALSKHIKAGDFDLDYAQTISEQALDLVDEFYDMQTFSAEALSEGVRLNHSTYDLFYLTLARRNGATLFTLDRRLRALCEELGVDCVHEISSGI
jgi:predicted nucleic acid-binding protein